MAEQMAWIDPASATTLLDGSGNYKAIMGRTGILAAPQTFIEEALPLQDGVRFRQVTTAVNTPIVPVTITAASESALITAYRALRAAMNPKRGAGILQYTAADATVRQLNCYLESGLEGDESMGNRFVGYIKVPLQFRAQDPFWYDATATTATYTTFGSRTINNTGDVECWPTWTIHGPTTNLTISNTTTGKSMVFTLTLGGSDVLVINTAPGTKTAILNDEGCLLAVLAAIAPSEVRKSVF